MLAIAAYNEENNPSAKQAISNHRVSTIDKPKVSKVETENDLSFDTATKLEPIIKLIKKNPWILAEIKQETSLKVALNSKYNVAIDNDGYSIFLTVLDKKGDPVFSCIVDNESDHTEVTITDWKITTFTHKDGHFIDDGPFTASFTTAGKKNSAKLPPEIVQILKLI